MCQFERARVTVVTHATADMGIDGFIPANKLYTLLYRGLMHNVFSNVILHILNITNQPKIMPRNKCSIGEVAKSMYHQMAEYGLF